MSQSAPSDPIDFDADTLASAIALFARSDPAAITQRFPALAAAAKAAAREEKALAATQPKRRLGWRAGRDASFHDLEHRFWGAALFHSVFAHASLTPAEFLTLHLPHLEFESIGPNTATLEAKAHYIVRIVDKWGQGFWKALASRGVVLQRDPSKNLIEQLAKVADDTTRDDFATRLPSFLAQVEPIRVRTPHRDITCTIVKEFVTFYERRWLEARRREAPPPPTKRAKTSYRDTPGRGRASVELARGVRGDEDSTGLSQDLEQEVLGDDSFQDHHDETQLSLSPHLPPRRTETSLDDDELGSIAVISSGLRLGFSVSHPSNSFSSAAEMPGPLNSGGRSTLRAISQSPSPQTPSSLQIREAADTTQRIRNTPRASLLDQLKPHLDDVSTTLATVRSARLRLEEAKAQLAVASDGARRQFSLEAERPSAADIKTEIIAADAQTAKVKDFIDRCDEMEAYLDSVDDQVLREKVSLRVDRDKLGQEVDESEARRKGLAQALAVLEKCETKVEHETELLRAAEVDKAGNDAFLADMQRLLGLAMQVEVRL
ncbi:hypothetical protein K491DRAFT_763079 [Lophiostoma macrostomum CBS 122681]|uniref:Uncharacterized protein n=1 Tax=Lophiostoma macrostomum CBS 122681 TaxID=1314788 RepID=A0A6A6SKQ3_9PLEO|nr:hypothetical protein K491DRAFT_763079 [Lophiostoma macrostomum CBS 122681]